MAQTNVTLPATGSGTATPVVATDLIAGANYQQVKLVDGTIGGTTPAIVTAAGALKTDPSAVTQPVSGVFWQATQPISGTFWQVTQPVSGTFFQATQPVSGTFFQATQPVSGTFWQATQPVSGTVTSNLAYAGTFWHADAAYTTAQTATTLRTPTPGKRFRCTRLTITTGGTTAGVVTIFDNTNAAGNILWQGEFAPSATSRPGTNVTWSSPGFVSAVVNNLLAITTSAAMTVYVQADGDESA